jgi:hypothetical protein
MFTVAANFMNDWTACLGEGALVSLVQFVAATFAWPYLYNKLQTGDLAVCRVVHFSGTALACSARRIAALRDRESGSAR